VRSWTAKGFGEAYERWLDIDKPSDGSRRLLVLWAKRTLLDPFDAAHAAPYPDLGPGWWIAALPDGPDRMISVTYRVDDFYRTVSCLLVVFVDDTGE
jgi:hypothetical protein